MKTRIRKWGNSLALRIPKSFAAEASISDESLVDIKVVNGKLVIASIAEPDGALDRILAGINDLNLHRKKIQRPDDEAEGQ